MATGIAQKTTKLYFHVPEEKRYIEINKKK